MKYPGHNASYEELRKFQHHIHGYWPVELTELTEGLIVKLPELDKGSRSWRSYVVLWKARNSQFPGGWKVGLQTYNAPRYMHPKVVNPLHCKRAVDNVLVKQLSLFPVGRWAS